MAEQPFQHYYAELRELIEAKLSTVFSGTSCPEALRQAAQYSLAAPGKRLRPVLVLMAVDVCGGSIKAGLPAACAVEMVHTYSLIHDDLPAMDDDALRRGQPTCHLIFGEALAILAGDALLTGAFAELAASSLRAHVIADCVHVLASAAGSGGMVGGQVLDLVAERGPFPGVSACGNSDLPETNRSFRRANADTKIALAARETPERSSGSVPDDVEQLIRIHRMKTGALVTASLEIGAAVAGAASAQRDGLRKYGECCGLAFQIVDDLLDVTGAGIRLGKETGRDGALGKLTYPGLLGIDRSRRKAAKLVESACDALSLFGNRAAMLRQLAGFIVERDH